MSVVGFLRPSTALVERKVQQARSLTNEPINTIATIYSGLACRIDPLSVQSRSGGNLEVTIEGVRYLATDVAIFDGLTYDKFVGTPPGSFVTVAGVRYLVDGNNRGAYVDLQVNDRVTNEDGQRFLVLAIDRYSDVTPSLQARLAYGRAWADVS